MSYTPLGPEVVTLEHPVAQVEPGASKSVTANPWKLIAKHDFSWACYILLFLATMFELEGRRWLKRMAWARSIDRAHNTVARMSLKFRWTREMTDLALPETNCFVTKLSLFAQNSLSGVSWGIIWKIWMVALRWHPKNSMTKRKQENYFDISSFTTWSLVRTMRSFQHF